MTDPGRPGGGLWPGGGGLCPTLVDRGGGGAFVMGAYVLHSLLSPIFESITTEGRVDTCQTLQLLTYINSSKLNLKF